MVLGPGTPICYRLHLCATLRPCMSAKSRRMHRCIQLECCLSHQATSVHRQGRRWLKDYSGYGYVLHIRPAWTNVTMCIPYPIPLKAGNDCSSYRYCTATPVISICFQVKCCFSPWHKKIIFFISVPRGRDGSPLPCNIVFSSQQCMCVIMVSCSLLHFPLLLLKASIQDN